MPTPGLVSDCEMLLELRDEASGQRIFELVAPYRRGFLGWCYGRRLDEAGYAD